MHAFSDDPMVSAYIDAIYFTETGEDGQPSKDTPLHSDCEWEAWASCHRLRIACAGDDKLDLSKFDPVQIGHDLWFTRNGHGTGFYDRPEVYGDENARILTLMALVMGPHDAEFAK